MTDWLALAGSALAFVALSRARWLSAVCHEPFRGRPARLATQAWLATAGLLFAGGEALRARTLPARALWLLTLGLFALQMALIVLSRGARGGQRTHG